MLPHPLTNFEIQKYYQNEPRFNGSFSRDNLPRIKDGAHIINLDEYSDSGTHCVALHLGEASPKDVQNNNVTYLILSEQNIFGKKFVHNKTIKTNIFRIQANDSIMCRYFCIGFIDFMLARKTLIEFANIFSPITFKKIMI